MKSAASTREEKGQGILTQIYRYIGAGEGIRTPEPLRDRVLSPPRMCKCSAPLTWPHPFSLPEGLATPAIFLMKVRLLNWQYANS